jgi:anti-sigma regulatory factor (Ser/Thr protein kinase)
MAGSDAVTWTADDKRLVLTLPNERGAFEETRQAVLTYFEAHRPSAKLLYGIELVLEETLMNVIWHAFNDGGRHLIELTVEVHPDEVEMRFEDGGIAFDPLTQADPTLPSSIDDATPGGLGLMLVRKFAKTIAYARDGDRNRLTICLARD